ncbi:dTDP-4-dehydrorhamnose reductase [Corynebacterium sp. 13CS0277]|uniref:sugar nucleotide-binding protein n=1 Tax=Corynebacterium sp. 13CS0277 TaxID=2071994 RepID=UPI000D02923B|nr:bifunctional dTDP-4-dehydrorhamnose 3,5-epimerase family protein/NAD(P)-dependent oxidoreductase [Corynebacterium sp. 13CS0277]PRQ12183.1 dTDP-4-dehydrorhamnose reductase [Corynebacterium sp. 13CS0277]
MTTAVHSTAIDGLLVVDLTVHGDARGWFKENWNRDAMPGIPDFGPVQNNMSYNAHKGVTRGLHAEPWDKLVSVAHGAVMGGWCDLREDSPTFGATYTHRIDPHTAVFVPRGVANGFQALEDDTVYSYLVNDHWRPDAQYYFVNLDIIDWPLEPTEISDKDRQHPPLANATPVPPRTTLVFGAGGQLGTALRGELAGRKQVEFLDREDIDLAAVAAMDYEELRALRPWRSIGTIINAAAYTQVDAAEGEGRADAWAINAAAVGKLARLCTEFHIRLVHYSSEYVFDGTVQPHREDEPLSPLGVYGQTKAAGDIAALTAPGALVLRTTWVVGQGKNFVRTMYDLARRGVEPKVVDDQIGRITFATELARATAHLVDSDVTGVVNVTCGGEPASWADVADIVFAHLGKPPVGRIPTSEYPAPAPRPLGSVMDLSRLESTGFVPADWRDGLAAYLHTLDKES